MAAPETLLASLVEAIRSLTSSLSGLRDDYYNAAILTNAAAVAAIHDRIGQFRVGPSSALDTTTSPQELYHNRLEQPVMLHVQGGTSSSSINFGIFLARDPLLTTPVQAPNAVYGIAPSAQLLVRPGEKLYFAVVAAEQVTVNVVAIPLRGAASIGLRAEKSGRGFGLRRDPCDRW